MRVSIPNVLPLFRSEMQIRLLALLILQPERSWTLSDLASTLHAPTSSVHRELRRIEAAGLLEREESARPHRFVGAQNTPLFGPLRELLQLTLGVEDELKDALDVPGVAAAVIHGSWAAGNRRPDSDIDVVVVGDSDLRDLRRRTRAVAARAGRQIDLMLFSPDEFRAHTREGQGFARHLFDEPVVPLVGDLRKVVNA
jgi:predicted nucleotidyltransferase